MKVIKRDRTKDDFNSDKIRASIERANYDVHPENRLSEGRIDLIAEETEEELSEKTSEAMYSKVKELVEEKLINLASPELARAYIRGGAGGTGRDGLNT